MPPSRRRSPARSSRASEGMHSPNAPRSRSRSTAGGGSTRPPPISRRPCASVRRTPAPMPCSASATRGRALPPRPATPSRPPRPSTQSSQLR
uniref:Uncharacterized protein n=1 Tax=Arundo donax TaxID=35708 RepID=A0A0A9G394_ARUDO